MLRMFAAARAAVACAIVVTLGATGGARSADLGVPVMAPIPDVVTGSGWSFALAPYGWAAGIEGDIGVFGLPPVHVDESFSDILEDFDIGFMGIAELRYDRFGLFSDLVYAKTSSSADTPFGVLANRIEATTETLMLTAAGEYRVLDRPRSTVDLMAGMRVWSVNNELELKGGPAGGRSFDGDKTWVDPMLGARGTAYVTPRIYLTGWAMIGGFGVSSDFMWDLMAGAGYSFSDTFSLVLGYRATGVDYEDGGFVYDITQQGPITGLIIRF